MSGSREVIDRGVTHITQHVLAIEKAVSEQPEYAFDLSRTIMESACRTILTERGWQYEKTWELGTLFKETTNRLRLVPDEVAEDDSAAASLRKTLGGLHTVVQGVCELRKAHGFAAHGRDKGDGSFDALQALLVARAADTFVSYLFGAHFAYLPPRTRPVAYDDNPPLNEYIDDAHDLVRIFDGAYPASEVLFKVDTEAYLDVLQTFSGDDAAAVGDSPEAGEVVKEPDVAEAVAEPEVAE